MKLRPGWTILRAALGAAWVLLVLVTIHASRIGGANGWMGAFAQGLREPWPAQFDTDFTIHLCLMAAWLGVRARTAAWGVLWAVLALAGGSLFSLLYLFVLSFRVQATGGASCSDVLLESERLAEARWWTRQGLNL